MSDVKFTVTIRNYEPGTVHSIDTADVEAAVQSHLDEHGDDGIVIVEETD